MPPTETQAGFGERDYPTRERQATYMRGPQPTYHLLIRPQCVAGADSFVSHTSLQTVGARGGWGVYMHTSNHVLPHPIPRD